MALLRQTFVKYSKNMSNIIRTPEEIEKLKMNWLYDPIWDIYETEGFESHKEELKAYQESVENRWKESKKDSIQKASEKMGISGNLKLAAYITLLESKIEVQNEQIEKLKDYLRISF